MPFKPATKSSCKARIALCGPAGSGKTYSALLIASGLGKTIAVIDSERGSASMYADLVDFESCELERFGPRDYMREIMEARRFDVLIIDSLSHAWMGRGGCLDQVDKAPDKNSFSPWKKVTPQHRALLDAICGHSKHVIVTMRTKMEYVLESVKGKMVPRKVGMGVEQRKGVEYEFDVIGELDYDHSMLITKTRISGLDGDRIDHPGRSFGEMIAESLSDGEPIPVPAPPSLPPDPVEAYNIGASWVESQWGRSIRNEFRSLVSELGKSPGALQIHDCFKAVCAVYTEKEEEAA